MRLLLASMLLLAGCGSSGRPSGMGRPPSGGGGGPAQTIGVSPDAADALAIGDAATDVADAGPTFSCQLIGDAGGLVSCTELDPGYPDASVSCADSDAGTLSLGACPRDTSTGGCHVAKTGTAGYTVWWYAPLGTGAVLSRCEQMGDSYVSP